MDELEIFMAVVKERGFSAAAAHPRLRVSLLLDDKETDLLEAGVDLAPRIAYPTDSSYIAKPIVPVPRYLCASPEYLEMNGPEYALGDSVHHRLANYPVLICESLATGVIESL